MTENLFVVKGSTADNNMYLDTVTLIMKDGEVKELDIINMSDIRHDMDVHAVDGKYGVNIYGEMDILADDKTEQSNFHDIDPEDIAYVSLKVIHDDNTVDESFSFTSVTVKGVDLTDKTTVADSGITKAYARMWVDGIALDGKTYTSNEIRLIHEAMKIERGIQMYDYVLEDHGLLSDIDENGETYPLPPIETLTKENLKDLTDRYEELIEESLMSPADAEKRAVFELITDLRKEAA